MCYIGLTLREASQAQKLRCSVFKTTTYSYIKNGSHVFLYVKAVAHTEFSLNSVIPFSSTDCLKGLTVHRFDFPTCNFTVLVHSSINVVFAAASSFFPKNARKPHIMLPSHQLRTVCGQQNRGKRKNIAVAIR